MRPDLLELDTAVQPHVQALRLGLADAESLRLLLSGHSVIDWHKAAFPDLDAVDALLRLNLLDPDAPDDRRRLRHLFNEAITYVEVFRGLRVPPELRNPDDVRDVFLWASDTQGFRRRQMLSCMTLKLMHVIAHTEAADLKLRAPISEYALLDLAHRAVLERAEHMRRSGVPLQAFYGSRKTRASVIQKLLVKRDNLAAPVFDKLRYRVVVPARGDVLPALAWLLRHLVPFQQVLPGQTVNRLLAPDVVEGFVDPDVAAALQPLVDDPDAPSKNEFSGASYQVLNFVADLPVALAEHQLPADARPAQGRVVYVTVEFQVLDAPTAARNEVGDSAHEAYKARQWARAKDRLSRGAYAR